MQIKSQYKMAPTSAMRHWNQLVASVAAIQEPYSKHIISKHSYTIKVNIKIHFIQTGGFKEVSGPLIQHISLSHAAELGRD